MPVVTQVFRDAQALAKFSNLEPNEVEDFRHNYPDFAPQAWWDYKLTLSDFLITGNNNYSNLLLNDPFWKSEAVPLAKYMASINRAVAPSLLGDAYVFRPQTTRYLWQQNQSWLREAWKVHFEVKLLDVLKLLMSVFDPGSSSSRIFADLLEVPIGGSYHRGFSYLFEQKWRARFCQECKKRFVAGESRNKYCSDSCSYEGSIRRPKLKCWNKRGKKQRAARQRKARIEKRNRGK